MKRTYPTKKKDIIRVGDTVKIISPFVFVRIGYPLGILDIKNDANFLFPLQTKIEQFLQSLGYEKPSFYQTKYQIEQLLIYEELKKRKFGGNIRSIGEEEDDHLKDCVSKVQRIRYVKTGERTPAKKGRYQHMLINTTTHKVLYLDIGLKVLSTRVVKIK